MAPPLRIGVFPYLNVQPLIHGLRGDSEFDLVVDLPSRIAERFRAGELDLAMVPSFEAVALEARVLDSVCIAATGPVETVMLHHRVPLDLVRTLGIDLASRTSVALAKILIVEASGRTPECTSFSPTAPEIPDTDALIVIGDPAFTFRREGYEALDLGREWHSRYALPFVFAVMVAGPRATRPGISSRLSQAATRGVEAASTIARSYDSGVDAARAERYLKTVIQYHLGPREKEGLNLFIQRAQASGLLARVKEFEFHAI